MLCRWHDSDSDSDSLLLTQGVTLDEKQDTKSASYSPPPRCERCTCRARTLTPLYKMSVWLGKDGRGRKEARKEGRREGRKEGGKEEGKEGTNVGAHVSFKKLKAGGEAEYGPRTTKLPKL